MNRPLAVRPGPELDGRVARLVRVLQRVGVGIDDRVAWTSRNRREVLELALAAQRIGAVVVPVSYRASPNEVRRMLDFARPRAVVVEAATAAAVAWDGPVVSFDDDHDDEGAPAPRGGGAAPVRDRLGGGASLLFTSGTTGTPKAAMRTRGDPSLAAAIADGFGFGPGTRFVAAGPLYHSGPWTCALLTISRGGSVEVLPRFSAADWLHAAVDLEINASFLTPTQLRRLVEAAEHGAPRPRLTHVVVSGEPFPPELKRRAVAAFGPGFGECYGCTELGPLTWMPPQALLERPGSCGRPFPGIDVRAFSASAGGDGGGAVGAPLGPGEVGLLRARTPMAFDGYVHAPGATPDAAGEGWATVGDLGSVDDDGYVSIVGRTDDMIITGGVNVFPADVEAVLAAHPAVSACAVFGAPSDEWGQVVCAAVVSDEPLDTEDVRAWMRGRIADEKRPRRVVCVPELPETGSEKLSRRELRSQTAGS